MTKQQKLKQQSDITAEQVRDYLLETPDFFNQYPELLEEAKVTNQQGGVVSLTMRQLALLRDKNEKAHKQLEGLLAIARENDALFGRMQQLTTALIDARCVEDVFATLDDTLRDCFGADFFAIRLIANDDCLDFPISDVLWEKDGIELENFKRVFDSQKIKCGHPTHAQAKSLFNEQAENVHSVALIPLKIDKQDGLLAIGSKSEDRFHPTMGTLFLAHLGELVGKRLASLQYIDKK
ncbi:MAG: hypothetical protein A6F70_03235 [Cycloclasticus sp. symbiont of Bathymodiolus heckerae]|nr:MAG: hypothetical protein A6F70_03235 [Cycloclasticus sp. symbiont of Bathymodiolus heckerae]